MRDSPASHEHRKNLLAALLNLKGVGPLPLRDTDLMMLMASDQSRWPIAKGELLKESSDGTWAVKLDVEGTHRWLYVEQHLLGNPFLAHVDHLKKAIAEDLVARLSLMSGIADRVEMPAPEGIGLEVIDFDAKVEEQEGVHPYFMFTLYDQLLSRALDLSHSAKRRDEFRSETRGTDHLGGWPVVSSPDPTRRATSVDYLVAAQEQLMGLPEVELAASAYRGAEQAVEQIEWSLDEIELGGHSHFMFKEICEQPAALKNTLRGRIDPSEGTVHLGGIADIARELTRAKRIIMTGCGTAWHAGLVGEYLFEDLARIPTEIEYASELRYRNPIIDDGNVLLAISQSGEEPWFAG